MKGTGSISNPSDPDPEHCDPALLMNKHRDEKIAYRSLKILYLTKDFKIT
jgi:hypothetical protein